MRSVPATVLAVVLVAAVALTFLVSTVTSSPTIQSTTSTETVTTTIPSVFVSTVTILPPPAEIVPRLVIQFLDDLANPDSTPLEAFYSNSSVLSWYGNNVTFGLQGIYIGTINIAGPDGVYSIFLNELHEPLNSNVTLSDSNLTLVSVKNIIENVTFTLSIQGWNEAHGTISATVLVRQEWMNAGVSGNWYIGHESWEFLNSRIQNPD